MRICGFFIEKITVTKNCRLWVDGCDVGEVNNDSVREFSIENHFIIEKFIVFYSQYEQFNVT